MYSHSVCIAVDRPVSRRSRSHRFRGGQRIDFLSAGVCIGSQRGGKLRTVSAQPSHSHFPNTRYTALLSSDSSFCTGASVCVCVCVSKYLHLCVCSQGYSQCLPCGAARFLPFWLGQTFPVCKHWRTRDTAVS